MKIRKREDFPKGMKIDPYRPKFPYWSASGKEIEEYRPKNSPYLDPRSASAPGSFPIYPKGLPYPTTTPIPTAYPVIPTGPISSPAASTISVPIVWNPTFCLVDLTREDLNKLLEMGFRIEQTSQTAVYKLIFPPKIIEESDEDYYLSEDYEEDWAREHGE